MRTIPEAAELLDLIRSMQDAGRPMPCPRCGCGRMNTRLTLNSLSRYADVYICNDCGRQEAMMDMAGRCFPLNEWSVVKSFDGLWRWQLRRQRFDDTSVEEAAQHYYKGGTV